MSSVNYENQILNAIETLVNNAVSKAEYDKTIKGIIVKCVDESQNKYVVKYQDSTFYAYANEGQSIFPDGTLVYILIPGNDMTQRKSIIDSVTNLGEDYIDVVESNDRYNVIGNNIINSVNSFDLCSYTPQGQELVLYDKADEAHAVIDVNKIAADAYLKKANYLTIGADFRTNLNKEQKAKGRYGIIFNLKFIDNNSGEDVIRTYILDTNNMLGNPYNYTENVNRKLSFEIDGKNFKSIEKISIFEYDFPNTDQSITTKDIFISNLSLEAAEMYTEDEILGYSLSFRTPQGIYFDDNDLDTAERRIEAIVKVKNKKVNENSDLVQYYWFKENNSININSPNYNRYGGNGWECLNNYNIVGKDENDNDLKEWLSGNYHYTTIKSANVAKENTYKCVVVYRGNIFIEKQFTIYNFSSDYEITIESDSGTYFYYDVGHPTLTCYVNGEIPTTGNWRYDWSVIDNNNQYNWLPQTTTDTGMRVVDNVIYDLQLSTIINFSIYKCSVYKNNVYVGKATITITNDRNVDKNTYTLVITNGDQIFKYNERGIAPNNKSLENPQMIYPLSFVLYDELGHEVDFDSIPTKDIFWTIPTTDTMLKASTVHGNPYSVDNDNHTATYNYYSTFYFDISTLYYAQKTRNTIQLLIKYKDKITTAQTNLSFLKEGENGSNGTDFICKIVPNVADSNLINIYPTVFYKGSGNPSLNFTPLSSSVWFKIQFYHDGEKIYDGTTSGNSDENKRVNIKWEILKNKYDNNKIDYSNYTIDENTGAITFNPLAAAAGDSADETKRKNNPSNIIKCTITYDNQTYYATMPIITVFSIDNYKSELVMNTGFRYAMYTTDGILPIYDNTNPFEIKVINGEIDITNDSTLSYNWSTRGLVYNNAWNEQVNLIEKRRMPSYTNNQNNYKPIDEFNGFCVNNAVVCSVIKNSSEIVKIHIPVQLYLNRFGNNAMNTWDGNHIEINNEGGFILAPQVGAGDKDSNNRFTGVFMGKVQESGKTNPEYGLYGYHQGARTIALNAEDGSARFGKAGKGQIVLDPTDDTAVLRSGDYVAPILDQSGNIITPGSGLEIDLTDPHITFGSGDFRVDKDGQVYAAGFATISKLEHGDYTIPQSSIENLTTFITETTNDLQDLQEQIDGNITTWFYAYVPTLNNEPASLWTTPQEKNNHLGDLFYNTTTGYCYRFMKDVNNNYSWQKISDSDISAALEVAQQAQDTADHKRRVFYETPVPPYDAGDLWVQGSGGDIKRCATPKTEQQTYNANDWVLASKYTDDTTLNNLKPNLVSSTLVEYALSDTTTTAPTTGWSTSAPEWQPGKYMWQRTTITYADGHSNTPVTTCIAGAAGRGIASTEVKYVNDNQGVTPPNDSAAWNTNPPAEDPNKRYLWTRTRITYDDNQNPTTSYGVSYKGTNGTDGSSITINSQEIKYGYNNSGTDYSTIPATRSTQNPGGWGTTIPSVPDEYYLWTRTTVNYSDNSSTISYSVSYQSKDGEDGRDAEQYYTHIMYATNSSGANISSDPSGKTYIGVKVDTNPTASTTPSDYTWTKFVGDNATQYYTYIRYSQYSDGHNYVTTPTSATKYVGLSVTTNSTAPAYNDSSWKWSKYVGEDGANGIDATNIICGNEAQTIACTSAGVTAAASSITIPFAGYIGNNRAACSVAASDLPTGITVDTNTAATTSADGSLILAVAANSDLGGNTTGIITLTFTCNSKTFIKKFAWSKAIPGTNGTNGKSIVVDTTTYSYCNSTSGTTHPDDSASWTSNPAPETGKYTWTKIVTTYKLQGTSTSAGSSTTYTVSYTGTNGGTGPQGVSVSSITPLYYLKTVAPTGDAPNAPTTLPVTNTSPNADAWTKVMPTYTNTGVYYTCDQIGFSNGTYSTSNVIADEGLNKAIVAADSSIVSTSIEYAVGSSTSDPPTTGWTSTTSTLNVGINQYLWTRLKNVLKNGNTQYSDERCLATQKKDLDRQYMEYVLSASEDNAPSSGWGISKPSAYISETPYLWVRTAFVYKIIGGTTISEVTEYKNTMVDKTWNQIFNIGSSLKDTQDEIAAAMKTGTVRIEGGNIIVANKTENPDNFIIINSKGIAFYSNNGGWIDSKFIEDNPTQISSTWNIDGTLNMQNINVINLAANSIANQNLVLGSQESTGDLDIYDRTNRLMFETVTTNDGLIEGFKIYKRRLNQDNSFTDLGYIYLSREKGFQEFDNNGNQIFGNNGSNYFASRINRTNQQIITNKTPEQSTSGEYGIQMIPMSVNNAGDSLTHIGVAFLKL